MTAMSTQSVLSDIDVLDETRSTNGAGNSQTQADYGAVGQVFTRIAQNSYTDGAELMARARPLEWAPAGTQIDAALTPPPGGRPVFLNNPNDEVPQGRAGANTTLDRDGTPLTEADAGQNGVFRNPDGSLFRIPLTDDLRFVNQPAGALPQARDVSNAVFAQPQDASGADIDLPNRFGTNDFHLFFGQALTHDMVETQVNVTAVSVPTTTGIGWAGGAVGAGGNPTAAFLVRVNPTTGQAVRDAQGQLIAIFPPDASYEAQVAALKAGALELPQLILPGQQPGTTVTIPAVSQAQQQQVADALVNHQALSLGAPFALQRTPGVYDEDGVRQQANTETAFLDLGNVYGKEVTAFVNGGSVSQAALDSGLVKLTGVTRGSDGFVQIAVDTTQTLRKRDADGNLTAFMLTSDDTSGGARNGQDLLPTYGEVNAHHGIFVDIGGNAVDERTASMGAVFDPTLEAFFSLERFAAGDQRVNQNVATVTQQTIWMRNHNHWAEELTKARPDLSADQIFDLARAINEAEYQRAIYEEYLPTLIGEAGVRMMGEWDGYDPSANPAIINEWTTIAFRFGHDQSSNFVSSLREDGALRERVLLIDSFTRAGAGANASVPNAATLDDWMRGQLAATHQAIDGFVVEGNRGELFGVTVSPVTGQPVVNDLTVFDIVRGRDHGVNSYVHLRAALGLDTYLFNADASMRTPLEAFQAWAADNNVSQERLAALIDLYAGDFTKLDAYVGVLLEKPFQDSQLGITSTMLVAMQFAATRDGDRFWYENRFADQPDVLAMIEASSMAQVIQRTTGIDYVYRDAFFAHERAGGSDVADTLNGRDSARTGARDLLIGFAGDDTLNGLAGDDDLYGGEGSDALDGGVGDDLLDGEAGGDVLAGGVGVDTLRGGAGDDILRDGGRVQGQANGTNHYDGGDGVDTVILAADRIGSGSGQFVNRTWVDLTDGVGGYGAHQSTFRNIENVTLDWTDTIRFDVADAFNLVRGDASDNVIIGSGQRDVLRGEGGADRIDGRAGDDDIFGGEGDDVLMGGAGRNHLDGGAGDDRLGGDSVRQTTAFDGGAGVDTLMTKSPGGVTQVDLAAGKIAGGHYHGSTVANVENLTNKSPNSAVSYLGDANANRLEGGNRNDELDGRAGDDDLIAGDGNDVVYGGAGADLIFGGGGNDFLNGGDRAAAGAQMLGAQVSPGDGADLIDAGAGNDYLRGSGGNDTLIGGLGNDVLLGDDGADAFRFAPTPDGRREYDIIRDFDLRGDDVIQIDVANPNVEAGTVYTVSTLGNAVIITLASGDTILVNDGRSAGRFDLANPSSEIQLV